MTAIPASLRSLGACGRPRRRGLRWLLAAVLAGAAAALGADLALACSCVREEPRESLSEADAAFVGVVTARRVTPSGPPGTFSSGDPAEVDFRVERAYKGTLGDQVTVHTVAGGATCGLEVQVGQRVGLFLQRRADGGWSSSLCSMVDPDALAEAAKQLPRPSGSGPVRFLLGGEFGEPSVIALDRRGRPLAYGAGRGSVTGLEVCPGGRRSLETAWVDGRQRVYVRDLRSMRVLRRVTLAGEPLALSCRTADAHRIVALLSPPGGGSEPSSRLVQLSDRGARTLHRGSADAGSIEGRYAWLASGREARAITRIDLRTRRAQHIVSLAGVGDLVASPDGRRAAFVNGPGQLCVAAGAGAVIRGPARFRPLAWVDGSDLVARTSEETPTPARVFDRRLRSVRSLRGLDTTALKALVATGSGGRLYAIADDRLLSVRARRGRASRLARVTPGGSALATVGGATRVSARARRAPVSPAAR